MSIEVKKQLLKVAVANHVYLWSAKLTPSWIEMKFYRFHWLLNNIWMKSHVWNDTINCLCSHSSYLIKAIIQSCCRFSSTSLANLFSRTLDDNIEHFMYSEHFKQIQCILCFLLVVKMLFMNKNDNKPRQQKKTSTRHIKSAPHNQLAKTNSFCCEKV